MPSSKYLFRTLLAVWMFLQLASTAHAYDTSAKQAMLVDLSTDTVLFEKEADKRLFPASMSKLMTTYIVFELLKEGTLSLEDELVVSEKAWRKGGSKMFVKVGDTVTVEDLLRGIIVQSGNDACIVVAEGLAGSEEAFAEIMNRKAESLGMKGSHFTNSTGWPDDNHYMTAEDLILLGTRLIKDFPDYYSYFSENKFSYNGISQPNRNTLLSSSLGVDGLKTGHTDISGYGIIASATKKGGRRLLAVVHGTKSMRERIREVEKLLRYGFNSFKKTTFFDKNQEIARIPVWFGEAPSVPVVIKEQVSITLPAGSNKNISMKVVHSQPAPAPVEQGAHIADLEVVAQGKQPFSVPLYAAQSVDNLGASGRIIPVLEYHMFGAEALAQSLQQ